MLPDPFPKTGKEVGIYLGVKTLATLSDRKAKVTLKLNEIEAKIKKKHKKNSTEKNTEVDTIKKH